MALTALQVKNATPKVDSSGKTSAMLYSDGAGLYLRVAASGSKSWIYRFQLNGKRRDMGIGNLADLSLAEARGEVATLGKLVRQGIDPIDHREAQKAEQQQEAETKAVTFGEVATIYIDGRAPGWQNPKHVEQWRSTLKTYCKDFYSKSADSVTIDDVEAALRPIWLEKTETATRVLTRIISVMIYAHDKKWRKDDDAETWATRLRRRLPDLPKKANRVKHFPALPYEQLTDFMADLRASSSFGAKALEFGILCASRSGEIRLAQWCEIDFEAGMWVIPAERMKADKEHRIPLSTQAIALLRSLPEGKPTDYIFPGDKKGKPLSDMTLTAAIRRRNEAELKWMDESGNAITQHGFRSTFRDWAAETTPFPSYVVEMALAHTVANKVEAAYRRGDLFKKRRELMQAWADYCDEQ